MDKILLLLTLLFTSTVFAGPVKISYGVTVCYEGQELNRLLHAISVRIDPEDEIIILRDMSNTNASVTEVIKKYSKIFKGKATFKVLKASLDGDFGAFKNRLISSASPGNYLFQIDADELPSDFLLLNLKWYISLYPEVDLFFVPRVNRYLGASEQQECIGKCDDKGREAFPDGQGRVLHLKNRDLLWKGRVHEKVINAKKPFSFPSNYDSENWALIHIRHLDKFQRNYGKDGIVTKILGDQG